MVRRTSCICLLLVLGACRPKEKPTPLALVPEDVAVISWLPEPKSSVDQLTSYLRTFDRENLGDQIKALRLDWLKQTGIDPLDPKTMEEMGLDLQKPWALTYDIGMHKPVALLAAKDPSL